MNETKYLVYLEEKGFIEKISKGGIWSFTKKISNSKKYDTLLGAFIRLSESKKIEEFKKSNSIIIIEELSSETEDGPITSTITGKLIYKSNNGRGRPKKETKDMVIPNVLKEEKSVLHEGHEPKKRRGRPRKKINNSEEKPTITFETQLKTKKQLDEENPLIKKKVETDLNITVLKASTDDSFWD